MLSDSQYKDKIDFYLSSLDELGEVLIDQEGSSGITKGVLRIILGTMMVTKGAILGINKKKCKVLSAQKIIKPQSTLNINANEKLNINSNKQFIYYG